MAGRVDQVISLRFPSYAVRHPGHVCWLNHTMREYYDSAGRASRLRSSPRARLKERVRRSADRIWPTGGCCDTVTTKSSRSRRRSQRRLLDDLGVRADVLLPPPPPRAYRCDGYGDYIFAVSRLTPLKRLDLLIRALAEPWPGMYASSIAGEGEGRAELHALAESLGVGGRVTFTGRLSDGRAARHLGACRAVCFHAGREDYGFVTVEAFASRKAVVTCSDSGGPAELVRDERSGFVCEPTPAALAAAFARLMDDRRAGRAARRAPPRRGAGRPAQ